MKDYSHDKEKRNTYITKYEINDDIITVTFADRTEHFIPFNDDNMKTINDIMNTQVSDAKPLQIPDYAKIVYIVNGLCVPINICTAINNPGDAGPIVLSCICGVTLVWSATRVAYYISQTKNIEKLKYFAKNMKKLNMHLFDNPNMTIGLSKKATEEIESYEDKYVQPINFSNIDSFTLKDLQTVMGNIEKSKLFNYDEENDGPTRRRNK